MDSLNPAAWNALVRSLPNPQFLQTWEWARVKEPNGWKALPQTWSDAQDRVVAAALVLQRSLPIGGFAARVRLLYVPRGPLLDWNDAPLRERVLNDLKALAHRQGAIFIKIDPAVPLGTGFPGQPDELPDPTGQMVMEGLQAAGWRFSEEQIQFRNTVQIDLTPDEDALLANMKQKTRYNVRLAMRKGVVVRLGDLDDLGLLYQMYAETSLRDGFVIRERGYYEHTWALFMQAGMAQPLIAQVEGQPVAGLILFYLGSQAWYHYGMSRDLYREMMPNYLLQWEAMRWAKAQGCQVYDLWGAPDAFNEQDRLWGVYRFKEGLGGQVVRHLGAWDLPINPLFYRLYTQTLPRLLDVMRKRGKQATQRSLNS